MCPPAEQSSKLSNKYKIARLMLYVSSSYPTVTAVPPPFSAVTQYGDTQPPPSSPAPFYRSNHFVLPDPPGSSDDRVAAPYRSYRGSPECTVPQFIRLFLSSSRQLPHDTRKSHHRRRRHITRTHLHQLHLPSHMARSPSTTTRPH